MVLIMSLLTTDQIETFLRDGLLVVPGLLSATDLAQALAGLAATLQKHGVHVDDLQSTAGGLAALSSTAGSGGVLDLFYDEWKMNIALQPALHAWTQQLWKAAYCQNGETLQELAPDQQFKWHPYGAVDKSSGGYAYIDRICYRLPTALSDELGRQIISKSNRTPTNKNKKLTLQRSLTPHLDCCPDTFDDASNKSKWRPIQCFVSLTDNTQPNTGGLEVAQGFHHEFRPWTAARVPTIVKDRSKGETRSIPPPCLGEYTHIRPTEDADVMQRVQHVPVPAGSAVFWDNRLPHANAYRHEGEEPRIVVYCSFLPPVSINRAYAERQLQSWLAGRPPTDQWMAGKATTDASQEDELTSRLRQQQLKERLANLPELSRKLLALEDW